MIKLAAAILAAVLTAGGAGYYVAPDGTSIDAEGCEFYNLHEFQNGQVGGNFLCTTTSNPDGTPTPSPSATATTVPSPTPTTTPIPPSPTPTPTSTPSGETLTRHGDWGYLANGAVEPPAVLTTTGPNGLTHVQTEFVAPYCAWGDPAASSVNPCSEPSLSPGTYTVSIEITVDGVLETASHEVVVDGSTPTPTPQPPTPTPTPPGGMTTISNPNGHCLVPASNTVIENVIIGPCGHHGIHLVGKSNVTIRNVVIHTTGAAVSPPPNENQSLPCWWCSAGIYAEGGSNIVVEDTQITDTGRQLIIFNNINGGRMTRINVGITDAWPNRHGWDGLSAYNSDNIEVEQSWVYGGDLNFGCALITDGTVAGGQGHHFHDNIVGDYVSCGLGIAGGSNSVYERNTFDGIHGGSANGLGIYLWAYGNPVCDGNVIRDNVVTNSTQQFWNAGDCTNSIIEGNSWQ